jgi:hypothetical protein
MARQDSNEKPKRVDVFRGYWDECKIVLSPADYEEVRRELGWQPARRFDANGAHYEVD